MSELTRCNYCSLRSMKARAKKRGVKLIIEKDSDGWISVRYSDQEEPSAWFMVLTAHCVC